MTAGAATRLYASLESVKAAVKIDGSDLDAQLLTHIAAASRDIEEDFNRNFIPVTDTKYFPWPMRRGASYVLYFDNEELLALTTLKVQAHDSTPTTITNYFLEPINLGPPYRRVEIDLSSTAFFQSNQGTPQRSVSVLGRWGFSEDTVGAGTLAVALSSASATTCAISDASLIGVGDTLLIDSEALFVSGRAWLDTTATLNGDLTAANNIVSVTVSDGTKVKAGETVLLDSEQMLVTAVTGAVLTCVRAVNASVLAAHTGAVKLYAGRTLTIVRGVNGTTAATHLISTAIAKYAPPGDIVELCIAQAISYREQGRSGWSGMVGDAAGGAVELRGFGLRALWDKCNALYGGSPARVTI